MKNANQIAALFTRGKREGQLRISRAQVSWLFDAARREGLSDDRPLGVTADGVRWYATIIRNGSGILTLSDARAEEETAAAARADREQKSNDAKRVITHIDERLAAGLVSDDDLEGYLEWRSIMEEEAIR